MRRFAQPVLTSLALLSVVSGACVAFAEGGNSFFEATSLEPGVLSVSDSLTPGVVIGGDPLFLRVRAEDGMVGFYDEAVSLEAAGPLVLNGPVIPQVNQLSFDITGINDLGYSGGHNVAAQLSPGISYLNDDGSLISTEAFPLTNLLPGTISSFTGTVPSGAIAYNIEADVSPPNGGIGQPTGGDVDFYRFTGLPRGADFVAEMMPEGPANLQLSDSVLGWFDGFGNLIEADDDGGAGLYSRIEGLIPESGELLLAATAFSDFGFVGGHLDGGAYRLDLQVTVQPLVGDFNGDGAIDAADYTIWRDTNGSRVDLRADASGNGVVNLVDYNQWRSAYGSTQARFLTNAVPEPSTLGLILLGFPTAAATRKRTRQDARFNKVVRCNRPTQQCE